MIRPITESDYLAICEWWKHHKWQVVPAQALPPNGYIALIGEKRIVAGFLYRTDSNLGWLEWIVSNPDSTFEERTTAINELLETIFQRAKELKIQAIFTSCKNESLIKRLIEKGFQTTDQGMTSLIKGFPS